MAKGFFNKLKKFNLQIHRHYHLVVVVVVVQLQLAYHKKMDRLTDGDPDDTWLARWVQGLDVQRLIATIADSS